MFILNKPLWFRNIYFFIKIKSLSFATTQTRLLRHLAAREPRYSEGTGSARPSPKPLPTRLYLSRASSRVVSTFEPSLLALGRMLEDLVEVGEHGARVVEQPRRDERVREELVRVRV